MLIVDLYALVGREICVLPDSQDSRRPQGGFVHELNTIEDWYRS